MSVRPRLNPLRYPPGTTLMAVVRVEPRDSTLPPVEAASAAIAEAAAIPGVRALQVAKPRDAAAPELLAAAREVASDFPAYITVNYHRVRLLPPAHARALADQLLAGQTLAFARAHPQDPRVPEALYLVVRATRFGCTGDQTGDFSHRAFDLLHRRYAATECAAKTPYWFK